MKKNVLILFLPLIFGLSFSQWQADQRLTNDPAISYTSNNNAWNSASVVNFVHTVWYDYRNGDGEIYYKRSTTDGISWGTDTRLTNNIAHSWYPAISVSNTYVHVVWSDLRDGNSDEIYYKRSTNSGTNWQADTRLTNQMAFSRYPSIAASGNTVHVVWQDMRDGNYEIYYKRSSNGGTNWSSDTRLTNQMADSKFPSVCVNGYIVNVVWSDLRDGNSDEIYFKQSVDGGITWGTDTRLTVDPSFSQNPSISASGVNIHVVWQDLRNGNFEVYYKRSTNNGSNWGSDTRLTNAAGFSQNPSITSASSFVHIVWWDDRDGNREIYYKRSSNSGSAWGTDTRLTNQSATSQFPSISISGSNLHVLWYDIRDGNFEIYYKRNPDGNSVEIAKISTEIPTMFNLFQNYPNPFNPTTKIRFDIPPSEGAGGRMVQVIIYNIIGREVVTLVNEQLQSGTYELVWDASECPSGVYFYSLIANDFNQTKKLVLIK